MKSFHLLLFIFSLNLISDTIPSGTWIGVNTNQSLWAKLQINEKTKKCSLSLILLDTPIKIENKSLVKIENNIYKLGDSDYVIQLKQKMNLITLSSSIDDEPFFKLLLRPKKQINNQIKLINP
jgi:hypothetical protein